MKVASFFAGIGGIDLGLERAGFTAVFQCEIDPYCQRVLAKHWPEVPKHDDIRTLTADAIPVADVWAGGFPCQPFSLAGDRKGEQDERHLWPVWYYVIREARPRFLLLENVPGLLSANGGRVFGDLLRDLATSGYDAEWYIISARSLGALHIRERLFVIAYDKRKRVQGLWSPKIQRVPAFSWCKDVRGIAHLRRRPDLFGPLLRRTRNGIPRYVDRIRGIGNSVVPAGAELLGSRLLEIDRW